MVSVLSVLTATYRALLLPLLPLLLTPLHLVVLQFPLRLLLLPLHQLMLQFPLLLRPRVRISPSNVKVQKTLNRKS